MTLVRKFLVLSMVLGLVAGSVTTAEAAQKSRGPARVERTVEGPYGPLPAPVTGCTTPLGPWACMIVPTRWNERFFTAKVMDLHGQPVFVRAYSGNQPIGTFCGETTEPIRIQPGATLSLFLVLPWTPWELDLECPANRVKSTGTIVVTLSNQLPAEPVRSGSIVGGTGWFLDNALGGCQGSPECSAWLNSRCDHALTGWNPGITASIVDVDDLADDPSVERVFRFGSGQPWALAGGVELQFWDFHCKELADLRWRSTNCDGDGLGSICSSFRFRLPSNAKWMTVIGYQADTNLAWTLI